MSERTNVYQFKVSLHRWKPPIWRRIQMPENSNFLALHQAIQDVMGWSGEHLHQFVKGDRRRLTPRLIIGNPKHLIVFDEDILIPEKEAKIADIFKDLKSQIMYEYDFGSTWYHDVVLEKIVPAVPGVSYPRCTAGRRENPHEECVYLDDEGNIVESNNDDLSDEFHPELVIFKDPKQQLLDSDSDSD